jgi:phosphonate transport system substrate-binding protein
MKLTGLSFLLGLFSVVSPLLRAEVAKDPDRLVFAFQKQKHPEELRKSAEYLAEKLSERLGKKVEVLIPGSYSASVQGLISNKVHVAYMDSLPYILAQRETRVEILAVEQRNGKTSYDSLIVTNRNSGINSLADLKSKKIAFTSQTSTSGYLMPLSRLIQDKVITRPEDLSTYFSEVLYAGGYDKALQSVSKGAVDVAAFSDYVLEGQKADLYGSAKERESVRILTRTKGIPTHLIAVKSDLSSDLKSKIQKALLELSQSQPELISSTYGAAQLVLPKNPEKHVERTRQALKDTGFNVNSFVK